MTVLNHQIVPRQFTQETSHAELKWGERFLRAGRPAEAQKGVTVEVRASPERVTARSKGFEEIVRIDIRNRAARLILHRVGHFAFEKECAVLGVRFQARPMDKSFFIMFCVPIENNTQRNRNG